MSAPFAKSLDELPETTQCVVDGLRRGLLEIFADDLAAIWLYGGSLFAPIALDIDLHVLLARRPQPNDGRRILELHATISNNTRWINELDCWYILLDDASRPEPPANVGPLHPGIRDEHWPLHRAHWLAGACIVVHGTSPSDIVWPPGWHELEGVLRRELIDEADEGGRPGGAASPYWTLQLCRVLASLETRDVVRSKLDSGAWALGRLPRETHPIIKAAMRYYSRSSRDGDEQLIERTYGDFYAAVRTLTRRD